MALSKLTIQGYEDGQFGTKRGEKFTVMVNPANYDHSHSITYSEEESPGKAAKTTKFKSIGLESMNFSFTFDDTGAVPRNTENDGKSIPKLVSELKDVVYKYYGSTHEPNFLILNWGSLLFKCRLESLKVEYQMFKPSGVPLRAKITAAFKAYIDAASEAQIANRNSPDLTHIVTVKEGDNLPQLCHKIYKNKKYYLEVAALNNLVDIRHLVVGSKLYFPPIK